MITVMLMTAIVNHSLHSYVFHFSHYLFTSTSSTLSYYSNPPAVDISLPLFLNIVYLTIFSSFIISSFSSFSSSSSFSSFSSTTTTTTTTMIMITTIMMIFYHVLMLL